MSAVVTEGITPGTHADFQPPLDRTSVLRQELKDWEARFAAQNGGRKATREEIKEDVGTAAKYSEYRRLREGKALLGNSHGSTDAISGSLPGTAAGSSRRTSREQTELAQIQMDHQKQPPTKPHTPRKSRTRVSKTLTPHRSNHANGTQSGRRRSPDQDNRADDHAIEDDENKPLKPAFVGPTPQKDGRVLGLFDLLSPVAKLQTPTKSRVILGVVTGRNTPQHTPNRVKAKIFDESTLINEDGSEVILTGHKHSRTPQSASKRFLLDAFVTPSKRRRLSDVAVTPTSTAKAVDKNASFATPAFLRRHSSMQTLPAVTEDENAEGEESVITGLEGDAMSPGRPAQAKWLKRRPTKPGLMRSRSLGMGRSLSSMIAEMRQAEEDKLDEEMDLLRELEGEACRPAPAVSCRNVDVNPQDMGEEKQTSRNGRNNQTIVEDSEIIPAEADLKLLGPDGTGNMSDEDVAGEGLDRNGNPLRVWKKKGMKRQTKKVLLRPTLRKPNQTHDHPNTRNKTIAVAEAPNLADTQQDKLNTVSVVAETQFQDLPPHDEDEKADLDPNPSDSEAEQASSSGDDSAYASASSPNPPRPKRASKPRGTTTTTTTTAQPDTTDSASTKAPADDVTKENPIKKAVKKISATAHANFRRLKIRSAKGAAGAKAGGGRFGGRFGGRGRR